MPHYIYEVVKEYVMTVEGLDFPIKARISRRLVNNKTKDYRWEVSHHYRPSRNAASVYYPSKLTSKSFKESQFLLLAYMGSFTQLDVTPNPFF